MNELRNKARAYLMSAAGPPKKREVDDLLELLLDVDECAAIRERDKCARVCDDYAEICAAVIKEDSSAITTAAVCASRIRSRGKNLNEVDIVENCTDCGSRLQHELSRSYGYCRDCAIKGGLGYLFFQTVDIDKVRQCLGKERADQVLIQCKKDW